MVLQAPGEVDRELLQRQVPVWTDGVHTVHSYDANGNTLTETEVGQVTR
tara:strand:- start:773 stop:919 length:147 start_codon:yes stop_codon:yes gene_type:complete